MGRYQYQFPINIGHFLTLFVSCITGQERSVPSSTVQKWLSIEDLKEVMEELVEAKNMWFEIGIQLDVPINTLDSIKHDERETSKCYSKMLQEWLRNGKSRSWEALAEALGTATVNHSSMKQRILLEHCTQN